MDPDSFPAFFKWDPRSMAAPQVQRGGYEFLLPNTAAILMPNGMNDKNRKELSCLEELFKNYGVRCITLSKMVEMGFTANTLVNLTEQELDDVVRIMAEIYSLDLLVGEKYGIKSAIRAERRRLDEAERKKHMELFAAMDGKQRKSDKNALDTLSQEGLSVEEPNGDNNMILSQNNNYPLDLNTGNDHVLLLQNSGHLSTAVSGLMTLPDNNNEQLKSCKKQKRRRSKESGEDGEDRQREHPFIVTEPGELARGKMNGLDYLFDLYEQCGKFLLDVQHVAKETGEECPTKVTNEVYRHAKHSGIGHIDKPKMRHFVHHYALHCLDVDQLNRLKRSYKERGRMWEHGGKLAMVPLSTWPKKMGGTLRGFLTSMDTLQI